MIMSDPKPSTKVSSYRQSGWQELATGFVHIYYNGDAPADVSLFSKIWDNVVTESATSVPYVEPVPAV
jgi:hypothetical protein